jgi:hypothetical protein
MSLPQNCSRQDTIGSRRLHSAAAATRLLPDKTAARAKSLSPTRLADGKVTGPGASPRKQDARLDINKSVS